MKNTKKKKRCNFCEKEKDRKTEFYTSVLGVSSSNCKECSTHVRRIRHELNELSKKKQQPPMESWDASLEEIPADIPDLRDEIDKKFILEAWDKILKTLTQTEYSVIFEYFFQDKNLAKIGKERKLSIERIRQIRNKALIKLRKPYRRGIMKSFNIPIAEEWFNKEQLEQAKSKEDYIPIKPEWVKVEYNEGVPYLSALHYHMWQVKPITHKVYAVWLTQAIKEDEINTSRKTTG